MNLFFPTLFWPQPQPQRARITQWRTLSGRGWMARSLCYMGLCYLRLVTASDSSNMQLEGELDRQKCNFCSSRDLEKYEDSGWYGKNIECICWRSALKDHSIDNMIWVQGKGLCVKMKSFPLLKVICLHLLVDFCLPMPHFFSLHEMGEHPSPSRMVLSLSLFVLCCFLPLSSKLFQYFKLPHSHLNYDLPLFSCWEHY